MSDTKAAVLNFLNALEKIPKTIEQYKARNEPLDRKIQAEIAPPQPEVSQFMREHFIDVHKKSENSRELGSLQSECL